MAKHSVNNYIFSFREVQYIYFGGGRGGGHVFTLLVRGSPPPDIIYELQRLMHQGGARNDNEKM